MSFKALDAEPRRVLVNMTQLYEVYLSLLAEQRSYRGSMKWIKRGNRQYLFRQRNSRGDGKSLGPRNARAEDTYRRFHQRKAELAERERQLSEEIRRQAKYCVAADVNRVPRISADIIRQVDRAKVGRDALLVVGTHAMYAYENMAGVQFSSDLMTTLDIDLLWDAKRRLKLVGVHPQEGLMAILRKVDRSFERLPKRTFQATNNRGFLVDLIKPPPKPVHVPEPLSIGASEGDLVAAEIHGLSWLYALPAVHHVVVGANGMPLVLSAPDPRAFAAHKLWVSKRADRNPSKKQRDWQQGVAVAQLVKGYLQAYPMDDDSLRGLPEKLRDLLQQAVAGEDDNENWNRNRNDAPKPPAAAVPDEEASFP